MRNDIRTWAQVEKFMAEIQTKVMPDDQLQWSVYIFPDFEKDESLMIMKIHHCVADGLGACINFCTLQDKYSRDQLIQTSQVLSKPQKLILFCLKPFLALYGAYCFITWKDDKSSLKGPQPAGKKTVALCKAFDVETMKQIAQRHGKATINDVVLALSSVSMH